MRNLKRALSLVMAMAMLLGMMVIGASAASYEDFTDKDEIQNKEAVQTLVALNVIAGKDTGGYDPTGTLTRAEMAKLIAYALNGGTEPVLSIKAVPSYSDIDGHWAESYIEYCTSMKIIAGDGAGRFNPEGTLTGSQAAKMLLVAMNYDANVFGLTGNSWEINTNREANSAGLYEDLGGLDPSAPISRDNAAQLVYNAILAETMELSWGQNMETGEVTQTYKQDGDSLFVTYFNGTVYGGVLKASGSYNPYAVGGTSQNNFVVDVDKVNDLDSPLSNITFTKSDYDLTALVGEYVKVLAGKNKTVYGVYSSDKENGTILTTTTEKVDEVGSDYIKVDGTVYDTEDTLFTYGTIDKNVTDNLKLVDNDNDGAFDVALVTPVGVGQVTFLGSESLTVAKKGGTAVLKASNQELDDVITYEGIASDDYVVFTKDLYSGKDLFTKADVVEGTLSGIGTTSSNTPRYLVDGTWYQVAGTIESGSIYTGPASGDTVKMVALGSKLYYMEKSSGANSVDDLAMLITAESDNVNGLQARLLFADGNKKVVTVDTTNSTGVIPGNVGKLFSFSVNNDGNYELTLASTTAWDGGAKMGSYTFVAGTPGDVAVSGGTISTVGGKSIADDAVVFVSAIKTDNTYDSANNGQVITGKELKALSTGATTGTISSQSMGFFTSSSNGLTRASILCVTLGNNGTGFDDLTGTSYDNYGYLVADAYATKDNGTNYIVFQLWDGTETVTVRWAKSDAFSAYTSYTKHDVIAYDTVGDGLISNVTVPTAGTNTTGVVSAAVTGLDGSDVVFSGYSDVYQLNSDTKYLYVNSAASSADSIGVEGGSLRLADKPAGTDSGATPVYVQNVKFIGNTESGKFVVELVVVDVNNRLADRATTPVTPNWTKIAELSINGSKYSSGDIKLAVGDVVSITAGDASSVTVNGLIPSTAAAAGDVINTTVSAGTTVTFIVGNDTGISIG